MLITIRLHDVTVPGRGPHLRAVGYMPSGQALIEGPILEGHDIGTQAAAVSEVAGWLRANRPGFNIETLPGEGVIPHGHERQALFGPCGAIPAVPRHSPGELALQDATARLAARVVPEEPEWSPYTKGGR